MIECSVNGLTKYYGANKIFENISMELKTDERIGLIGQNGCGKSTLFKIMIGVENYDEGSVSIRKDAKIGYLNQIPHYSPSTLAADVIYSAFEKAQQIKKEMTSLEEKFNVLESDELDKVLVYYGKLCEQFELLDGYEMDTKVSKIKDGLKLHDELLSMRFEQLSGGEKTRVILGKILLEQPDILLLDEPTNHLDMQSIEWLEEFLKSYKGAVLIISHDRFFLDSVVNRIIELEYSEAINYYGNYSYYVAEKERRFLIAYKQYMNQQKKIANMERQIQRYRIWGAMRDSDKMYRRAKELEKRLEKIDVLKHPVQEKRKVRLNSGGVDRSGKIVLEAIDLSKRFSNKIIFQEANFIIYYQDTICLIGSNGSGKTTLIKTILGEIQPDSGTVSLGARVKIGYLPQHVVYDDEELTILEYFSNLHNLSLGEARNQLAKVLFMKEDVNKKIKSLSGGEKSRLKLCSLTFEGANFMILDEPTNHLDIDSREVLEEMLMQFDGTLLIVSHDRYFINKLADRMMVIENSGINLYDGDYSDYLHTVDNGIVIKEDKNEKSLKKEYSNLTNQINSEKVIRKSLTNIQAIEAEIGIKEKRISDIKNAMIINSHDSTVLEELFNQIQSIQEELEKDYTQWEALQIQVEELAINQK